MDWKKEYASSLYSMEDLREKITFSDAEREYFLKKPEATFACAVPGYYFALLRDSEDDPIRRQAVPRIEELTVAPYELSDPLGEEKYKVTSRLIHRYTDRVLFLATDTCAMYCRHCFRRNFTSQHRGPAHNDEVRSAADYISVHTEVKEVIFSGGDPLMLDTARLERFLSAFKDAREDIIFRIGTRMPVVMPSRIDDELTAMLSRFKPLFVMTQYNHPRECTEVSIRNIEKFIDAGIPVLNQAVLLKKVNDSVPVLEELFHCLVRHRIKPYYLFQGDLAPGTAHLRVSLRKGLDLMKELRRRISGLALPVYAVDLPGGGGKIPLTESYISGLTSQGWELKDALGNIYMYPNEE